MLCTPWEISPIWWTTYHSLTTIWKFSFKNGMKSREKCSFQLECGFWNNNLGQQLLMVDSSNCNSRQTFYQNNLPLFDFDDNCIFRVQCRACRIPPWTAGQWSSREQPTSKWNLHTGSNREWFFKSWEVSTLSVYQAAWVRQRPSSAKICRIP